MVRRCRSHDTAYRQLTAFVILGALPSQLGRLWCLKPIENTVRYDPMLCWERFLSGCFTTKNCTECEGWRVPVTSSFWNNGIMIAPMGRMGYTREQLSRAILQKHDLQNRGTFGSIVRAFHVGTIAPGHEVILIKSSKKSLIEPIAICLLEGLAQQAQI